MFRTVYLVAMGALVGLVTASVCGHAVLWLGVGLAVGVVWSGALRGALQVGRFGVRERLGKAFFFEKKNQKTFASLGGCLG